MSVGTGAPLQVFADGYFAGVVDDFDGTFQSLRLEQGGQKIEVRTLTIREDLRPSP